MYVYQSEYAIPPNLIDVSIILLRTIRNVNEANLSRRTEVHTDVLSLS